MKPEQIEEISQKSYNLRLSRDPVHAIPWNELQESDKVLVRKMTEEIIAVHLATLGECFPSVEECVATYGEGTLYIPHRGALEAVRNLLLASFAKQMEVKDSEIAKQQKYLVQAERREQTLEAKLAMLKTEDFYRPDHRLIYDAILELYIGSRPVDIITVAAGELEEAAAVEAEAEA